MKISWVISAKYKINPDIDLDQIKAVGPSWGSWQTWSAWQTDNVICYKLAKSRDLVKRKFYEKCNLYISNENYQALERPSRVQLYGGNFDQNIDNIEDIIAMHLAAQTSDIVLLLGFDFATPTMPEKKTETVKITNRHGLMRSAVAQNPDVQWLAIDHIADLDKRYAELANLTRDKMQNVLKLLTQ